jgi:hypothetical protein
MLTWPDHHRLSRGDIAQRRLSWICMRHPYGNWESVGLASEDDGYSAREVNEESRCAIVESVYIRPRRQ